MITQEEKYRYSRQTILPEVGMEGQEQLKQARVLVIGAGGLGCPILQYLTSSGVGNIGIVDYDIIDESNLHRQLLYTAKDVGKNKAEVAIEKLKAINPFTKFTLFDTELDSLNAESIIKDYDIIVDGSDNFACRYVVNDACVIQNKPFVYGAIYKFEGQVSVFNFNDGPTYRCLFPNPSKTNNSTNCSEIGVMPVIPGIIGLYMANEVMKIILGLGKILSGELFIYNFLTSTSSSLKIKRKIKTMNGIKNTIGEGTFEIEDYKSHHYKEATLSKYSELNKYPIVLDVREYWEKPTLLLANLIQIPLDKLEEQVEQIPREHEVLVCCQSGGRSKIAIHLLSKHYGYTNLINLQNGLNNLADSL